jgi:hypothetical protein
VNSKLFASIQLIIHKHLSTLLINGHPSRWCRRCGRSHRNDSWDYNPHSRRLFGVGSVHECTRILCIIKRHCTGYVISRVEKTTALRASDGIFKPSPSFPNKQELKDASLVVLSIYGNWCLILFHFLYANQGEIIPATVCVTWAETQSDIDISTTTPSSTPVEYILSLSASLPETTGRRYPRVKERMRAARRTDLMKVFSNLRIDAPIELKKLQNMLLGYRHSGETLCIQE